MALIIFARTPCGIIKVGKALFIIRGYTLLARLRLLHRSLFIRPSCARWFIPLSLPSPPTPATFTTEILRGCFSLIYLFSISVSISSARQKLINPFMPTVELSFIIAAASVAVINFAVIFLSLSVAEFNIFFFVYKGEHTGFAVLCFKCLCEQSALCKAALRSYGVF